MDEATLVPDMPVNFEDLRKQHVCSLLPSVCPFELTSVRVALHVRVNFCKSYREHLATTFRRESKSWLVGSLRSLLRVPELRDLSEYKVSVYT